MAGDSGSLRCALSSRPLPLPRLPVSRLPAAGPAREERRGATAAGGARVKPWSLVTAEVTLCAGEGQDALCSSSVRLGHRFHPPPCPVAPVEIRISGESVV